MSKRVQLAVVSFLAIVLLGGCHAGPPENGNEAITVMAKYNQQGRHDDAIRVAQDWLKRHPEDPLHGATFYEQIAITYLMKDSKDSARKDEWIQQAVTYYDKDLSVHQKPFRWHRFGQRMNRHWNELKPNSPKPTASNISQLRSSAEQPLKPSSEVTMLDTRRCFLKNLARVSSSFLLFQSSPPIPEPRRRTPIDPPPPAEKEDAENPVDTSRNAKRAQLQAQEKQFRETMAQLFTKVRDLKLQVDALHPSDVFSVAIFRQTQEIEKLAKQLKNYAKA